MSLESHIAQLFGVSGKHILVTGGSSGIGLMIAHGFITNGATVYITLHISYYIHINICSARITCDVCLYQWYQVFIASRKIARLTQVASELNKLGPGTAFPIQADLSIHISFYPLFALCVWFIVFRICICVHMCMYVKKTCRHRGRLWSTEIIHCC